MHKKLKDEFLVFKIAFYSFSFYLGSFSISLLMHGDNHQVREKDEQSKNKTWELSLGSA